VVSRRTVACRQCGYAVVEVPRCPECGADDPLAGAVEAEAFRCSRAFLVALLGAVVMGLGHGAWRLVAGLHQLGPTRLLGAYWPPTTLVRIWSLLVVASIAMPVALWWWRGWFERSSAAVRWTLAAVPCSMLLVEFVTLVA
jgi:hypothetical protein